MLCSAALAVVAGTGFVTGSDEMATESMEDVGAFVIQSEVKIIKTIQWRKGEMKQIVNKVAVIFMSVLLSFALGAGEGTWINTTSSSAVTTQSNWANDYVPTLAGDSAHFPSAVSSALSGAFLTATWPTSALTLDAVSGISAYQLSFPHSLSVSNPDEFLGLWSFSGKDRTTTLASTSEHVATLNRMSFSGTRTVAVPEGTTGAVNRIWGGMLKKSNTSGELQLGESYSQSLRIHALGGTVGFKGDEGDMLPFECGVAAGAYLHLDASETNTMAVAAKDGVRSIESWSDVRGEGYGKATGCGSLGRPHLEENGPNGRSVVSFGNLSSGSDAGLGTPGVLQFPRTSTVREYFIVTCDGADWVGQGQIAMPLGDADNYHLHRGSSDGGSLGTLINPQHASRSVRSADICWNGEHMDISAKPDFTAWHIESAALNGTVTVGLLASDRPGYNINRNGGVKIAEVVLYTRSLTSVERTATLAYLKRKWFPARESDHDDLAGVWAAENVSYDVAKGREAHVGSIHAADGKVRKRGAGTLAVDAVSPSNILVEVSGGAIRFNAGFPSSQAQPAARPFIHLDADDGDSMTKSYDEGSGRTYVSEWRDQSPGSSRKAVRRNANDPMPFLVSEGWNGHGYLDFGTFVAAPGGQSLPGDMSATGAACMLFDTESSSTRHLREMFIVIEDVSNNGDPFFVGGAGDSYSLHRAKGKMLDGSNASTEAIAGYWKIDGLPVESVGPTFPSGCTVLSCQLPTLLHGCYLARERNCRQGGLRYGEILIYDRVLTERERRETEDYLLRKWKGISHPQVSSPTVVKMDVAGSGGVDVLKDSELAVCGIAGTGTFVKGGSGSLEVAEIVGISSLKVDGSLTVGSIAPDTSDAYLHLDASRAETIVADASSGDGTTYVASWVDVRQNGMKATAGKVSGTDAKPTLKTWTGSGLTCSTVDLGDYVASSNPNPTVSPDKTCSFMTFPKTTAIKEVFVVFGDREGETQGQFILSDATVWGSYNFQRGYNANIGKLFHNGDGLADFRDKTKTRITLDGENVSYSTKPTAGLHVISVSLTNSTSSATANALGNDRSGLRIGGVRYGEVLLFTNVLTEVRRQAIIDHLNRKWMGTGRGTAGVTSDFSLNGKLKLGGSVGTFAEGSHFTFGFDSTGVQGSIVADGPLDLPVAATVSIDIRGNYRSFSGDYTLISAPSFTGDIGGWALSVSGTRYAAELVQKDGKIILRLEKPGLLLMVR